MARAIWSGSLGFGLVQIPVSLHAAEEKDELAMHMLDKRDFSPIGYERINKKTGKTVSWDDIVKGYEHAPGEYVVLTDEDFEEANVKATRQIDILDFVDFAAIDPRYIDRPYYIAPQKAGQKAYALLRETLKRTSKAGIAKVVIRTRQHLAAVVAHDKTLLLVLMRFADELRDESELELPSEDLKKLGVTPREVAMAEQLVEGMVSKFEPEKYEDDYHRDLMNLIRRKVKAGEVNQLPEPQEKKARRAPSAKVIDLAELLAQSVQGHGQGHAKRSRNGNKHAARAKHPVATRPRKKAGHTETHHRKSA